MTESNFTFRQRWFPNLEEVVELDKVRTGKDTHSDEGIVNQLVLRWTRSIVLSGMVLYGAYQAVGNNIEYHNNPQMVGTINTISSNDGLLFRTIEGQILLETKIGNGIYVDIGTKDFSIDRSAKHGEDVEGLYANIKKYMDEGSRVKITYIEQMAVYPWRADTRYLVQSIKPFKKKE